MPEIIINDQAIGIRALTLGEIKQLKDCGYSWAGCSPSFDQAGPAMERCLDQVVDASGMAVLETLEMAEVRTVWREVLKLTYGASDQEKNLLSASDTSGTKTE